ncbi:MAG TPA: TadE family protein [Thermomicrobiales bacterium]
MNTDNARSAERGQGLVELAFAMPLLLLLLLGTIDMGRMFFDYIEMRNGAAEGATYGSRRPTDIDGITAVVVGHGVPADATITVTTTGACTTQGGNGEITVTASRTWTPVTLDVLKLVGGDGTWSFRMSAHATMRCLT